MYKATIALCVCLATSVLGTPIQTSSDSQQNGDTPNVVPGVFISADTLKDLQSKAQTLPEGEISGRHLISDDIIQEAEDVTPNSSAVQRPTANQQPLQYQQQPMMPNQGLIYQQQPPQYVSQQPQYLNQQPQYLNQQPQYQQPQYVNQQQQYQQPSQQQIGNSPPMQFVNGQQQPLVYSNQQYPVGQQAILPNQQQPIYQQPIGNQPTLVYPNGQQPINSQPLLYPNGQALAPQNQPIANQPILVYPNNQVPNQQVLPQNQPGSLYTLVPVNNGNSAPNSNLAGGAYLVPNQGPVYNNGK